MDTQLVDDIFDTEDVVARRLEQRDVAKAVHALPERLRIVIIEHYANGRTLREIATSWSISEQRVSQLHCRAIAVLRDAILRSPSYKEARGA